MFGLLRSILIYYGTFWRTRRMVRFYGQFIGRGDLCFDVGAHVGNRIRWWRKLGARVVAIEPQPVCLNWLNFMYGRDEAVEICGVAVGENAGILPLYLNRKNPTLSTLSRSWIDKVSDTPSFATQSWEGVVTVPVRTLDSLIAEWGMPAFCKIDVEGYEADVLRGLSTPIPTISFEYIPAVPNTTQACLTLLENLATYEYNWFIGEQHQWQSEKWLTATQMTQKVASFAHDAPSGDIYARIVVG